MKYADLVAEVQKRARASTAEEARAITEAVLRTAISLMPPEASRVIYKSMPESLKPVAAAAPLPVGTDVGKLIQTVAEEAACSAERSRYHVQAVFHTLADHDRRIGDVLAQQWPEELLHSPRESVPPGPRSDAAYGGPKLVDAHEITRWLAAHPDWSGDTRRLQRTVSLPADRLPPLRNAFEQAQHRVNHSGHLSEIGDSATFSVWTRSVDRITELDLDLASRIDDLIDTVGSGG